MRRSPDAERRLSVSGMSAGRIGMDGRHRRGGQNCYKRFWRGNHHAPIFAIRNGKMPDESRRTKSEQSDNVKGCVLVLVRVISKDDLPDRTQNRVAERPITWPLSTINNITGVFLLALKILGTSAKHKCPKS